MIQFGTGDRYLDLGAVRNWSLLELFGLFGMHQ